MSHIGRRKFPGGAAEWLRAIWKPVALSSAVGVGVGAALMNQSGEEASGHLSIPAHQSGWIYDSGCDWSSRVDPVNAVFVGPRAVVTEISDHAGQDDHGGFGEHGGSTKYFIDHGGECIETDDQASTGFGTRHHIRLHQGVDYGGVMQWDTQIERSDGGYYAGYYVLSPAHYERYVTCGINPLSHAVYPNGSPEAPSGGFNHARDYVVSMFTEMASDDHDLINWVYKPTTTTPREQCNGDLVSSDGFVAYISMPYGSGGGGGGGCGRGAFASSC